MSRSELMHSDLMQVILNFAQDYTITGLSNFAQDQNFAKAQNL